MIPLPVPQSIRLEQPGPSWISAGVEDIPDSLSWKFEEEPDIPRSMRLILRFG